MLAWTILLITACGGPNDTDGPKDRPTEDSDTPDTDTGTTQPGTVALAGRCPLDADLGGFTVDSDQLLTTVGGAVTNSVVPVTILEEVESEGGCVLLRQNNPFCDPSCSPGFTCDWDGSCVPYPVEQDLGTVTIDGLKAPVTMDPSPPGYSYYFLGLPHPPYAPGDLVTLNSSGGAYPAFSAHGVGLVPLQRDGGMWTIYEDQDLVVTWNDPAEVVRSTVHVRISIDQHGDTPVQLECDFEDTGQATIPASLLTQMINFGVTGIPSAKLTRWTVDSVQVEDGCLNFAIASTDRPEVDVDGYTPCQSDEECPPGETCNVPMEICE